MKQKILAIFLSVVMLLGMLPASIIAGATDGETADTTTDTTTESTTVDDGAYTLLNVPDYETKLTGHKGIGATNWPSGTLAMYGDFTEHGDPDIDPIYNYTGKYDSSSGYFYVKEVDGETFMVFNPKEVASTATEYTTTTTTDTQTTTDDAGNTTTVTTTTTNSTTTANSKYYITESANCNAGVYYNNINAMANVSDTATTGGLLDANKNRVFTEETAANIKWLAMRIKVVGGEKGQLSVASQEGTVTTYMNGSYLLNLKTGALTKTGWDNVYMKFTDEFDGWVIVPFESADGADSTRGPAARNHYLLTGHSLQLFFRNGNTYDGMMNDWRNRSFLLGDMKVFADFDKFVAAHTPEVTEDPSVYYDDTYSYKGVDGAYYYMNVWDENPTSYFLTENSGYAGYRNGSFYKIKGTQDYRAYASDGLYCVELDGESFIEFDKKDYKDDGVTLYGDGNVSIHPDKINTGETYDGIHKSVDKTNLTHMAIRVKIDNLVDGLDEVASSFSLYMNYKYTNASGTSVSAQYADQNNKAAYYIDKATGEITYPEWKNGYTFTGEFDGWIVFPFTTYDHTTHGSGKSAWLDKISSIQVWLHDTGCGHGFGSTSRWANMNLYIGDMVAFSDEAAFICGLGYHKTGEAIEAKAPSAEGNGNMTYYVCANCKETFADAAATTPVNPEYLVFDAASLTLEQNIAVNFKVNALNVAGFENLYAKFTFDGKEKVIEAGEAVDGQYVFTFDNVGPHNFGKAITAQLFGYYEGEEYESAAMTYSVKDYCYNKLDEYDAANDKDTFKTLLIDLLNYGAKAQTYSGTDTNALVNADLKYYAHQKVLASEIPDITGGTRAIYDDLADDTATWNGVNLYFEDVVGLKFRFTAPTTQGVTVRVSEDKEGANVIKEISEFTNGGNGSAIAYFNGLDATEMRKTVYVAVYKNGEKISDTLAYDILAYVNAKITGPCTETVTTVVTDAEGTEVSNTTETTKTVSAAQQNLATLVSYMLRYGDAAAAYAEAKA
ncbi:MAG: hypothetical protein IJ370_05310 [Oscillospiraceae bacterium]|nr:hypothetical protein [Oscillospiraceae bacterium]